MMRAMRALVQEVGIAAALERRVACKSDHRHAGCKPQLNLARNADEEARKRRAKQADSRARTDWRNWVPLNAAAATRAQ